VQREQTHAAEHRAVHALDDRVVDLVVRAMSPPGEHVRLLQHRRRQAVLGLVQRGGPDPHAVAEERLEARGHRAVHAVGVARAHVLLAALVDVLTPDGHAHGHRPDA
jgi:hypothetical protein